MGRNANGRSSIYENAEGWHGRVTVGVKDNGSPDRRHVRGKTKAEVTAKVRKLEKLRDEGRVPGGWPALARCGMANVLGG